MQDSLKTRLVEYLSRHVLLPSSEDSAEFFDIYNTLPTATTRKFIDRVASMQDVVIVEIAGWYGQEFGLWIAQGNPRADVHVYDPFSLNSEFSPFLFNELNEGIIAKLRSTTHFDNTDAEASINRLYHTNSLMNIRFHNREIFQESLETIAEDFAEIPIVFVSLQTPTTPQEMTSQIAGAVAKYSHTHMVLAPYINDNIRAYADDILIDVVSQSWKRLLQKKCFDMYDLTTSRDARLFVALSLYYACLSAERAGAAVYRNNTQARGFPFQYPCCFVSTLSIR